MVARKPLTDVWSDGAGRSGDTHGFIPEASSRLDGCRGGLCVERFSLRGLRGGDGRDSIFRLG